MYAFLTKRCLHVDAFGEKPSSIWWCEPKSELETYVLAAGILSALLVISICVVDIDIVVSAFVAKRYHLDFRRRGSRVGVLQILYPAVHIIFRISEVVARIALLTACMVVSGFELRLPGLIASASLFALDFLITLVILRRYSPRTERWGIHIFVGLSFMIADMTKFVDRPGFCYPARRISLAVGRHGPGSLGEGPKGSRARRGSKGLEGLDCFISHWAQVACADSVGPRSVPEVEVLILQVAEAAASSDLRRCLCRVSVGGASGEDAVGQLRLIPKFVWLSSSIALTGGICRHTCVAGRFSSLLLHRSCSAKL